MPAKKTDTIVPVNELRWRLSPGNLSFKNTDELEPLVSIIGQDRGVEAFRFGMGMKRNGYNVFVTGPTGTGRMATVRKLLKQMTGKDGNRGMLSGFLLKTDGDSVMRMQTRPAPSFSSKSRLVPKEIPLSSICRILYRSVPRCILMDVTKHGEPSTHGTVIRLSWSGIGGGELLFCRAIRTI